MRTADSVHSVLRKRRKSSCLPGSLAPLQSPRHTQSKRLCVSIQHRDRRRLNNRVSTGVRSHVTPQQQTPPSLRVSAWKGGIQSEFRRLEIKFSQTYKHMVEMRMLAHHCLMCPDKEDRTSIALVAMSPEHSDISPCPPWRRQPEPLPQAFRRMWHLPYSPSTSAW